MLRRGQEQGTFLCAGTQQHMTIQKALAILSLQQRRSHGKVIMHKVAVNDHVYIFLKVRRAIHETY